MIRPCVVLILAVALLAGCSKDAKDDSAIRRLSRSETEALNAQRDSFESSADATVSAQTHFAAGRLAESQGQVQQAMQQYCLALKLVPDHRPSLYRLGVVAAQLKAYPEAIAAWKAYVKASEGDATAQANLGFCLELAGEPAEAEQAYKAGIARDARNNPCRVNYGLMLARAGRVNEAIVQLQAVLPEAQVHYNLAAVYQEQGHKELAKAEYRKAVELDPTLGEAKMRLSQLE